MIVIVEIERITQLKGRKVPFTKKKQKKIISCQRILSKSKMYGYFINGS